MKILALRGRNLASLAGDFAIDFDAAPLARAGLFAITGPTGAGKSTLLDALCLALYDRLPRLDHASKAEVGGGGAPIAGDDVRTILRHGAADGIAEVDFVGRDGGRYRARWEVRRARGKAGGRLQGQALSLLDLTTGAQLGGGKRETLDAIRDKVGLDFNQFRRSVLLAQNEFDAFLRAKPAERAELLELMTGTVIYGRLSMAAHERCRDEKAALDALEEELKRVQVMPDERRAAVEADATAAEGEAARLEAVVAQLLRDTDWHRAAAALTAGIAEAARQHTATAAAVEAARPEAERLDTVRRALSARPLVLDVDRLAARGQRLAADKKTAVAELGARRNDAAAAAAERQAAHAADEEAEAAFKAAGPELDQAAALDAHIAAGRGRVERGRAAAAESQARLDQAAAAQRTVEKEHADCRAEITRIEAWLVDHQGRQPLGDQLDRWIEAIADHARGTVERQAAERLAAQTTATLATLEAESAAGQRQQTTWDGDLLKLDTAIAALEAETAAAGLEALDERRAALQRLESGLAALADAVTADAAVAGRTADLESRRHLAEQRLADARKALVGIPSLRQSVEAALMEARAALALAEAAEGEQAAVLRRRLVAGQPCPVCGSPDHPLDAIHSSLTGLLATHRQRVGQLEAERDELAGRQADATATERSTAEMLGHAAADADALANERDAVRHRWAVILAAVNASAASLDVELGALPPAPFVATADAAVRAAQTTCAAALAVVDDQGRAARRAEAERRQRAQTREELRRRRQELSERLAALAAGQATARAENQRARAEAQRAAAEMQRLAEALAGPLALLADWRRRLAGDANSLARHCRTLAEEWLANRDRLDRMRAAERTLAGQRDSTRVAMESAARHADGDRLALAGERAALDRQIEARRQLFDGRPTGEVRTAFNDRRRAAKARHGRAQDAWAAATGAVSAAEERVRAVIADLAATHHDLVAATAARDARLAEIGLDPATVREAMDLGDAWVESTEKNQTALRQAVATALAVLEERRRALAAHEANGRPERAADELAVLLPQRTDERDGARERLTTLRQLLADDDRRREAARETRERITGQRQRFDLWKGMADLIGSADGKKFRLFAQGLTLDRLLVLANAHMAELTPRYVLERAPGGDLDLQVIDRDMADEVRGVANLSGGERFLVSLSLALGLASMTGTRAIAESLFIDEGFGALDADSLDLAISALETLHATGRKVGVISHVQPMIERIGVQIRVNKLGGGRSAIETRVG